MAAELNEMSLTQILDLYYTLTRSKDSKNSIEVIDMLGKEIVRRVANKEYETNMPIPCTNHTHLPTRPV